MESECLGLDSYARKPARVGLAGKAQKAYHVFGVSIIW